MTPMVFVNIFIVVACVAGFFLGISIRVNNEGEDRNSFSRQLKNAAGVVISVVCTAALFVFIYYLTVT